VKHQYQIQPAILIAVAESQSRTELCLHLSEEYTILEAENTAQILHFLDTEDISAILYDDTFPGFSTDELLQLQRKTIPSFLFSDDQDPLKLTDDGPTFLFPRAYDMKVLKERLRSIVHARQLRSGPAGATPLKKSAVEELSLWSINACELQKGFALYTYRENKSKPIYVDEGFLALGRVADLQAFKEKYPDVDAFIKEQDIAAFNENVQKAMDDHSSFSFSIEMKSNENHGSELFFYASWIPYASLPDPVFSVMVLDSTQLVENQRELFALIERDSLTGIYNQETFYRKTEALLKGNPDTPYLFIRWNIERFKTVNDLFGNSAGNAILKSLGESFSKIIGKKGTYGRLYSDQFALCIPKEGFDATLFAKSVEEQLNANNLKAYVRSVFGIYEIIDPSMGISLMSDRANMALNTAKGNYQRPFAYYTDPLRKKLLKEQAIVNEMRKALDLGQFQIFLQPFYSITENRFTGAEALVRWIHPERGIIGPDAFVPLFEENGFIIPLDDHIIEQVCILQRRILDEGRPTVPIAVNLSRSDFYNQDLAKNILEKTDRYNIPHSLLMFEVTESVYSENPEELLKVMRTLQDEGFLILMDDFGSGYSSLNILKDVPIDILKLDSMFSREIGVSPRAEKIIRSIVNMASLLDLPLVIEGIETQQQVDFYRLLGCNTLQGFYFSRPLPVEQFLTLDLVHHRPAFITDQFFQHLGSFSLSEVQGRVLKSLFDEMYLFNYTDDRYQQLYSNPRTPSPSFPSQGSLSSFLEGVRRTRILPEYKESFSLFTRAGNLPTSDEVLKQRFSWVDTKGDEKAGSLTMIGLDNPAKKNLVLCCMNAEEAVCRTGGEMCQYKGRYAMIEQLANIKMMEWDIEQDTLYRSPNLALLQLGKIGPKALIERDYCTPFIHEEDLSAFEECVAKVLATHKQRGTTVRLKLLNGSLRWFNIQMHRTLTESGEPKRIIASLLDVDSKMRMSEQLRASRRKIDFLTTSAQWGVVMGYLTAEGEIVTTFHNPIFYDILGYSRTEYEALGIDYLSMLQQGGAERLITAMGAKQDFSLTLLTRQKSGTTIPIELSVSFSHFDQRREEFICYIFTQDTGPQNSLPIQETASVKAPEGEKGHQEGLVLHRQLKGAEHITFNL